MYKKLVYVLLFFLSVFSLKSSYGQIESRPIFIGINPSLTIEPYYDEGELDINVLPLVLQRSMTKRMDWRLAGILNYGLRNGKDRLSHYGLELATPIFFQKKAARSELSKGFYLSPVWSLTRNSEAQHTNVGAWIEPGYLFSFENGFALSLGLQFGGTYFMYDNAAHSWGNHFGVKAVFGKWI